MASSPGLASHHPDLQYVGGPGGYCHMNHIDVYICSQRRGEILRPSLEVSVPDVPHAKTLLLIVQDGEQVHEIQLTPLLSTLMSFTHRNQRTSTQNAVKCHSFNPTHPFCLPKRQWCHSHTKISQASHLHFCIHTCELSCSEESLKVVTILFARAFASENPNENSMISAIMP